MPSQDPISGVSAVSTGSVRIRPEHIGPSRKTVYLWLVTSGEWTGPLPIHAYVFDTGQHRAGVTEPTYFPSGATGFSMIDWRGSTSVRTRR